MATFKDKTVFISGASRGIGKAIGLRLAHEGANIVIAAKTTEPHPKLPGTIYTAAEAMEAAGGKALALKTDIRHEEVQSAVEQAVEHFGGIDILINNASAISLTPTLQTTMKRYDLMHQVNVRGTFLLSKTCIPHLKKSDNPHILNLSPPLDMSPKWFANFLPYTMTKYGMSMCVLGMSEEFKNDGIAVNALWPQTTIATAAVRNLLGGEEMIQKSRHPAILSDAAFFILQRESHSCTGNFFIDEDILAEEGITDLSGYAVNEDNELQTDLFLD